MSSQPPVDLKPYFLTVNDLDGRLDWVRLFGNEHLVEIDVGCGRGKFLVDAGLAHPEINYLGIEIDYHEGRRGAGRLQKRTMHNVRVLGGDVRIVFGRFVRPASVSAVHVYFPDPWWKRRHRRRRVFNDELAAQIATILQPGGLVHSWTDVEAYFGVISALMDHHPQFVSLAPPEPTEPEHDLDYRTSYERKRRQAGVEIFRGLWQRLDDD
jgi:tRNA (guanine-N7-)-methyltransferase